MFAIEQEIMKPESIELADGTIIGVDGIEYVVHRAHDGDLRRRHISFEQIAEAIDWMTSEKHRWFGPDGRQYR